MIITTYSPSKNINVVGEIVDNKINTENTFIITDQDKDKLVETLQKRRNSLELQWLFCMANSNYWVYDSTWTNNVYHRNHSICW